MTSSTYSKGGTKVKGGTKLLKGGTKLLKGGTKLLKGGTKLLKGGTKLLKGGTKLLKGGTKLLKGGTKSLGWATGGGRTTPPTPPPGYGPEYFDVFKMGYHAGDTIILYICFGKPALRLVHNLFFLNLVYLCLIALKS